MRQGATISRKLKVSRVEGRVIIGDKIIEREYVIRGLHDPLSAERFIRVHFNVPYIADCTYFEEHTYMMDVQSFIENAEEVDGVSKSQLKLDEQE